MLRTMLPIKIYYEILNSIGLGNPLQILRSIWTLPIKILIAVWYILLFYLSAYSKYQKIAENILCNLHNKMKLVWNSSCKFSDIWGLWVVHNLPVSFFFQIYPCSSKPSHWNRAVAYSVFHWNCVRKEQIFGCRFSQDQIHYFFACYS